ncbi:MAG: hypothetical protein U0271_21780 [Polyangiaceae bacterium]
MRRTKTPESIEPLTWSGPSETAWIGLRLATRAGPQGSGRAFRNHDRVIEALELGVVRLDDTIRVEKQVTTVGRYLACACLPPSARARLANRPWEKARLDEALLLVARDEHVELAARAVEALELLGRYVADRSGQSIALGDLSGVEQRGEILRAARKQVETVATSYNDGYLTDGERYNRTVDIWQEAADRLQREVRRAPSPALGALGVSQEDERELRAMRGLVAKPSSEFHEVPALGSFAAGQTPHELMMSAASERARAIRATARREEAVALLEDLIQVVGEVRIVTRDCGSRRGSSIRRFDGEAHYALRLEGRVIVDDIPVTDAFVLQAGTRITRVMAETIEESGIASVLVRAAHLCEAEGGVCAMCSGLDPVDFTWFCEGEPIGLRAAAAIARAAESFEDRFFHIC